MLFGKAVPSKLSATELKPVAVPNHEQVQPIRRSAFHGTTIVAVFPVAQAPTRAAASTLRKLATLIVGFGKVPCKSPPAAVPINGCTGVATTHCDDVPS